MPDQTSWTEALKIGLPILGGGLMGAILTAIVTNRRNRIQPIGLNISLSFVDVPTLIDGYSAQISLRRNDDHDVRDFTFGKLAVIDITLINDGNKDYEIFEWGVNIPSNAQIINFKADSPDRKHSVVATPEISIDQRANQMDISMKPFNRKEQYMFSIIASTETAFSIDKIILSKNHPVRFVNTTAIYRNSFELAVAILRTVFLAEAFSFTRSPVSK